MNRLTLRALLALAVIGCAAGIAAGGEFPDSYYYSGAKRPAALRKMEGQPAPKLSLANWIGEEQDLEDLKGKVVVVDFWATWCGPCMKALPHNVALFKRHKADGLMIIGVHDSKRGSDKMAAVAKEKRINYPLAVDAGGSASAYNLSFWPTYIVIDRKGIVRAAGLEPNNVDKVVEKLLKEGKAPAQPVSPAPPKSAKPEVPKPDAPKPDAPRPESPKPASPEPQTLKPEAGEPDAAAPNESPAGDAAPAEVLASDIPVEWLERDPAKTEAVRALLASGSPPAITSETWLNSEALALDDLRGKVVLLSFWRTGSGPSIAGVRTINQLMESHGPQGLVIIGVCAPDGVAKMSQIAQQTRIKYPICADASGEIIKAYAVDSYPDYYFIDRSGRLRIADCNSTHLDEAIAMLLAEK